MKKNKCLHCGNEVDNKYCNVSCQNSHLNKLKAQKRRDEYNGNPKRCSWCDKVLPYEDRERTFCSCECSNRASKGKRGKAPQVCLKCGTKTKAKQPYCKKCEYEIKVEKWKAEEITVSQAWARDYLLSVHLNCSRCGWDDVNEFTQRVPLEMHHNDGDNTNQAFKNLAILCPNCHSLTENFRYTKHNMNKRK